MQLGIFICLESISNKCLLKKSPVAILKKEKTRIAVYLKLRAVVMPLPKSYMISCWLSHLLKK